MNRFIIFAFLLLLTTQASAQDIAGHLKEAKSFYEQNDFYNAIDAYNLVVKKNPKNAEAWFDLGNSYYFSRNHIGASSAYGKLSKLIVKDHQQKNKYHMAYLRHGQSLMALEEYVEAKKVLLSFLRLPSKAPDFRSLKRVANNRIKSCAVAIELNNKSHEREFSVGPMPDEINSEYSDFAPIWLDSTTLIFTSLNKDKLTKIDPSDPFPINQQLYSSRIMEDKWGTPEKFENLSHDFFHTANGSFSENGKKFVFSQCQENQNQEVRCALYISVFEDNQWTKPEKISNNINRNGYSSTQPAFGIYKRRGRKSEMLYFVSDRPGGRGGFDIWYSVLKSDKTWALPVNCGSAINTMGNEITPYYHGSTTELFFSSDFHYGLGGYDVFKSYGGLKSYKRPENLGVSLNSSYDDTYFSWRLYLENGTLVSNRTGSKSVFLENCCDDIYYFDFLSAHIIEGHIVSSDSIEMENVELGLADLEHLEYLDSVNWIGQTDSEGNFKLKFQQGKDAYVVVAKEGYETHYIKVSELVGHDMIHTIGLIKDLQWEEQLQKITDDEVKVLSKESLNKQAKKGAVFVMEHIYFDFDAAEIKPESYQDLLLLEQFLTNNSKKIIEIGGHTDNLGSPEHNHNLSQRRAEALRNYLIDKGINTDRLVAVGYGEDRPIAKNQNNDGTDNVEGRRLNRRIEVRMLN